MSYLEYPVLDGVDRTVPDAKNQFERRALALEETAQLYRAFGRRTHQVLREDTIGPRSPALTPSSSHSYEVCTDPNCVEVAVCFNDACPSCPDPKNPDPMARRHEHAEHSHARTPDVSEGVATALTRVAPAGGATRAELLAYERLLDDVTRHVRSIIRCTVADARDTKAAKLRLADRTAPDGKCISCFRVGELVDTAKKWNKRTERFDTVYARYCRWCGDFLAEHRDILGAQALPPLDLVKLHHTPGRYVTSADVERVLAPLQSSARAKARAASKKRKKRK